MILVRLKAIEERVKLWKQVLPRVEIFYATKCNMDKEIFKSCLQAGTGFDVASTKEIKEVVALGSKRENIIFANPIKTDE
jgi:ornithine decarboxylase